MNQEHKDILSIVRKNPGLFTREIAEQLAVLGYYRQDTTNEQSRKVSKILDKMRAGGLITGTLTRPIEGGNPINTWTIKEEPMTETAETPAVYAPEPIAPEYSADELTEAVIQAAQKQAENAKGLSLFITATIERNGVSLCQVRKVDGEIDVYFFNKENNFKTIDEFEDFQLALQDAYRRVAA